jgi:hypothetical protein
MRNCFGEVLRDAGWPRWTEHPQELLLSRLPRAAVHCGKGTDGRHPGVPQPSISTRSVDDLVEALGMDGASKSWSRLCAEIDERVTASLCHPPVRCHATSKPRPEAWSSMTFLRRFRHPELRVPRMEDQVRTAIVDELKRQAEISPDLEVRQDGKRLVVDGPIGVDALVMVVAGAVAGGP